MRPYLAVLKDSFREAFASRVLWLTMGLIAVFLLAIAPLSLTPGAATELQPGEITDSAGLLATLIEQSESNEPSPGKHLWSLLSASNRERLQERAEEEVGSRGDRRDLRRELNALLSRPEFYDAPSWQSVALDDELAALAERDDLSAADRGSRNRRLLEAAFSDFIDLESSEALFPSYFSWQLDAPIPGGPDVIADMINGVVVATCSVLLGFLGIFVSILVTASLVPRTFEPGEISLLLSKPVNRSLLFLTRFVGGCAFTLLNVAFLLVGLWLVVGLRFDVWNHRLLLCIPIYLFLFMIYFAVSATAGALWRNSILAICLTLVFWFALVVIGTAVGSVDQFLIAPNRITEIVPAADAPLIVNQSHEVQQWDDDAANSADGWVEVFRDTGDDSFRIARRFMYSGSRFLPVYDAANERILAVEPLPGNFGSRGSSRLLVGYRENDWQRESAGQAPAPVHAAFIDPAGRVILVGLRNIYEFTGQSIALTDTQKWIADKLSGFIRMGDRDAFRELRPDLPAWKVPFDAALDPETGTLAVFSAGSLNILVSNEEGTYELAAARESVAADKQPAVIAIGADCVLLAAESGEIMLLDGEMLAEEGRHQLFDNQPPKRAMASPDGRFFAVLSHDNRLWLWDRQGEIDVSEALPAQGDILAAAFNARGELLIADRTNRVRVFTPGESRPIAQFAPPLELVEIAYRYVLDPLYTLLPKPGELNNLVNYLLTGEDEVIISDQSGAASLQQERIAVDLWTPFWSNAAFLVVMLSYACWRITRRDF
jgi:ABC-type transport system involved in multi-copper enzyme maturation permease subunit